MYRREAEIQPHTHALCKALKRAQRRVCISALQLAYVALGYSGALRELLLSKAARFTRFDKRAQDVYKRQELDAGRLSHAHAEDGFAHDERGHKRA